VDWFTIDMTDRQSIIQEHDRTGTRRRMRIVQWVMPTGLYTPPPLVDTGVETMPADEVPAEVLTFC
jgi:hypothetical protein